MVGKAFGLIEAIGLVAALEAADAALKAANIELIGYELTKGSGMILVKFSGDVGAIKVAVEAGRIAAEKVNKVVATHVIPRPHLQLSSILATKETPARKVKVASERVIDCQAPTKEGDISEEHGEQSQLQMEIEEEMEEVVEEVVELEIAPIELDNENPEPIEVISVAQQVKSPAELCNFCRDPACHRKKGDPKVTCIHYGKNIEEAE